MDAKRDWGHAKDYVEGMWRILQQDKPEDFVLATGEMHTVREFVEHAFKEVGIDIKFRGKGMDEEGYAMMKDEATGKEEERVLVKVDPKYFRPAEVEQLLGDPTKAKNVLGWTPNTTFKALVSEMVIADLALVDKGDLRS